MTLIQNLYSIRDSKSESFNQVWMKNTHGEAERDFRRLASDEKTMVGMFPDDYDLYYLGQWDTTTGILKPLAAPQHVLKASLIPKPAPPGPELNVAPNKAKQPKG